VEETVSPISKENMGQQVAIVMETPLLTNVCGVGRKKFGGGSRAYISIVTYGC
jgi:hypothetical protein